jgi:Heparinase II/III-like protein.
MIIKYLFSCCLSVFTIMLVQAQPGTWSTATSTWQYDFGTNTGIGQLNGPEYAQGTISTSTTVGGSGYLPSPPSGEARLSGHAMGFARWSLVGTPSDPQLRFASSHSGRVGKFALYMMADASPISAIFYKMHFNDSTTTACNWQFAIGNTGTYPGNNNYITNTGGIPAAGNTSAPELFAGVRWQMASGNFTFSYRDKATDTSTIVYHPVTSASFAKGGTYDMEFYCNNSGYDQTYTRGSSTYTVPARSYHMWCNGTQIERVSGDYAFPANELATGHAIDALLFTGQTSTSGSTNDNAAVLYLNNITVQRAADSATLNALAALLPPQPKGFGNPYHHRTSWDSLRLTGNYSTLLNIANIWRSQPLPAITDSIYRLYWTAGNSQSAKTIMTDRRERLSVFTWAECLLNDGTYTPSVINTIQELINQKSWNFPSEDRDSLNFTGTQYTIGLCAAAYAHDLAQAIFLLDDKIPDTLRQAVLDALNMRIFTPTLQSIATGSIYRIFRDLLDKGNHNAACLSGVIGAALTVIEDPVERAKFLDIALKYSQNYITGFTDDGYCSEGLSYYNYGFGFYIQLREKLLQATGGVIDLFDDPKIRMVATFAPRSEIMNGVYPAIADCNTGTQPSRAIMYYVTRTLDLGLVNYQDFSYSGREYSTLPDVMYAFPNAATTAIPGTAPVLSTGLRSYFRDAGILTVRPDTSAFQVGAVFKGGHNGELHNHNDVGSFTIVSGNVLMVADPGAIPYTANTFNDQRYSYKTINSYGHPVPLVNGKQQHTARNARALITDTLFTDSVDSLVMDITSVYQDSVPALNLLQRAFTYNRTANGYIRVKDTFSFSPASTYETAITTRVNWRLVGTDTIELYSGDEKLSVEITASGPYTIINETISEEDGLPYTRIGVRLIGTVTSGFLTMTFRRSEKDSITYGHWSANDSVWLYNPGTNTGLGELGGAPYDQSTTFSTTTAGGVQGYLPYPVSGSVRLGGVTDGTGKAKWWLEGDSANAYIRYASSYGGKVGKLSMYDIAQASPVTSIFYTIAFNDSTTTQCNWQFLIGRTAGSTSSSNRINGASGIPGSGTTSTPEIFASLRWLMESGVFTFYWREKPNAGATISYHAVDGIAFVKGGTYNMEFYCNNSAVAQTYQRAGLTHTVPAHSYHIWANNTRLSYSGSYDFPGGELASGNEIDGLAFTGQTSISGSTNNNAAQIMLSHIRVDHLPDASELLARSVPANGNLEVQGIQPLLANLVITNNTMAAGGWLRLTDLSGRTLLLRKVNVIKGRNPVLWPLPSLAKGIYIISWEQPGQAIQSRKIKL